jgi:hypothetical protein
VKRGCDLFILIFVWHKKDRSLVLLDSSYGVEVLLQSTFARSNERFIGLMAFC